MPTLPRLLKSPKIWIVAGGAVVLYAALGFLLVPWLVASGVRDYAASHYHRKVELGRVAFNPFTLELTLEHLALPDADGGPLLGFDRLYVHLKFRSLVLGGADFKGIVLDGPRARLVRRPDGRFNVQDLVPPPAPPPRPNAPPPRLWIDELAVRGGEASVVDQSGRTAIDTTLKPITFTLHDFSTRSEGNAYRLSARSTLDETLDWQGTFGFAPVVESRGTFRVGHLLARTIDEAGAGALPVELAAGAFDLNGSYELAERGPALALTLRVAELAGTDLELRAAGTADSWVVVPRLAVTGTTLELQKTEIVVEHVLLERPQVKAWRERDGTLNLLRLTRAAARAAATAAQAAAAAPETASPWRLRVPDIRVTGGDLSFEDRVPARAAVFHVAPLDATVGGFAVPAAGPLALALEARVNDGGKVSANGSLTLEPLAASITVDAAALGLEALQPYVEGSTALTIKGGTASARGTATVGAGGAVEFRGDASIDGLRTVDNALEEDFVKWHSVRLRGVAAKSSPLGVKIREIEARAPYARLIIGSNGTTNIAAVLNPHGAGAAPAAPAAQAPAPAPAVARGGARARAAPAPPPAALPIEIGLVRIADGSMNFADFSINPNVITGIQELGGTIKGLSWRPDARADVDLAGKVDRYAPVTIKGTVNFLAAVAYTNVQMSFHNVELGVLSPYSGKFAGYRIDKGKLSADLHYVIENRKLAAEHRIVINQLQLGERVESPDATSLPVKLAIALLKDSNGVIDLNLPVTGTLDDPKFRLGPLIWKVVVNLIEKAVTAPFKLLGALFGGGEEIQYVDFAGGSAALDEAGRGKLAALVKALGARPALNLDVPAVSAPAIDGAALADQRWRADLEARAARRLGARAKEPGATARLLGSPKDYRALLEEAYAQAVGHRPDVPPPPAAAPGAPAPDATAAAIAWLEGELKPRYAAGPADLDALAQARAAAVQSALLDGTGIDPSRVFVIKVEPLPAASAPVRMQLALH